MRVPYWLAKRFEKTNHKVNWQNVLKNDTKPLKMSHYNVVNLDKVYTG